MTTPYLTPSEKATLHNKVHMEMVFITSSLDNECTEKSTNSKPTLHRKGASLLDRLLENMYASTGEQTVSGQNSIDDVVSVELNLYITQSACNFSESPLLW